MTPLAAGAATPVHFRWVFAGQGAMGAAALRPLLEGTPPVAVLTSELPGRDQPVADLAGDRGVPLHRTSALGPDPTARWPSVFTGLDAAVACCWAERLQPGALRAPAHGWLNLHPSALPAWRGADPVGWQLLVRPTSVGCTVHRMTERLDEGPVVAEGSVDVRPEDDRGTLLERTAVRLGELGRQALADLAAGGALPERGPVGEATHCPPNGTTVLIDPRAMRATAGTRVARAFSPTPGIALAVLPAEHRFAFVSVGGPLGSGDVPGTVRHGPGDGVTVAFADRWVLGRAWSNAPTPHGSSP